MAILAAWWNPVDWVKAALGKLGGVVSAAADSLLGDIFEWLSSLLLRGVMWLFDVIYRFISEQTTPNLQAAWFQNGPLAIAQRVGGMLLLMLVILAVAETVWNRDGGQLLRAIGQDAPKVMVLTLGLTFVTTIGLAVADGVATMFMELFGNNIESFSEAMSSVTADLGFGAGVVVIVLMALFLLIVLMFVALELVFRESFVLILVPLCAVLLCTEVYRPTKGVGSRAARLLVVTIAAKPIIALCLAVGAVALGQQAAQTSVDAVEEPAAGPREITQAEFDDWVERQLPGCVIGRSVDLGISADAVSQHGSAAADECRRLLVPERCCGDLSWTTTSVLAVDPWQDTIVIDQESDDIDSLDTAAVAPTFGLLMAGLATMMLAAFSPFVLMRLLSGDPSASTAEARAAVGGSLSTVVGGAGKVGAMAKKAGGR